MKKEMLINVLQPEECRIAIIEDGILEELYVERTSHESYTGNIYKGKVVNLEPAIQAAFVDFSVGRNGFLHVSDVEPQYFFRSPATADDAEPGARDRGERDRGDRKREPRRDRGGPRRPPERRRSGPGEAGDPGASLPPRSDDRPRLDDRDRPRPDDRPRLDDRDRPRPDDRPRLDDRDRSRPDDRPRLDDRDRPRPDDRPRLDDRDRPRPDDRPRLDDRDRPRPDDRPRLDDRDRSRPDDRPRLDDRDRPRPDDRPRLDDRAPRDRDRDRGHDRERPDHSIRGRRDRSETPSASPSSRSFGEGLVDQEESLRAREVPPEPISQSDAPPSRPFLKDEPKPARAETRSSGQSWSVPPEPDWDREIGWEKPKETQFEQEPEPAFEQETPEQETPEIPEADLEFAPEPFDPDLPLSRTQRSRAPSRRTSPRPADPPAPDRTRRRVPPSTPVEPEERLRSDEPDAKIEVDPFASQDSRRPRGRSSISGRGRTAPADRDEPSIPTASPSEPPFAEEARGDEPPRRRGGRAAIRSRGGDWEQRPRDVPAPDPGAERLLRGHPNPRDFDAERGVLPPSERPFDSGRRRAAEPTEPSRDRERQRPHDRAGEPGYVPRRERLRSGEPAFGGDLFTPDSDWPERDAEPTVEREFDLDAPEFADADELGFPGDPASSSDPNKADGRRRRRRRGRRRDRERPLDAKLTPSSTEPGSDIEPEFDDFSTELEVSSAYGRELAPDEDAVDDLDDLDLEDGADSEQDSLDDDFSDDPSATRGPVVEEEIDLELEQEIRKEIEEIEELEREMGLRGPADAASKRGEEGGRGGRGGVRGRGPTKPPIQEIFRRGDEVLVQVIKESIGTKGPTLSTYISIPGRYLVLMPGLNRVGVSRKIVDEGQRRKLREIMHELNPPKGLGFIVRTAGLERTKRELARDLAYLLRLWKVILRRIKTSRAPTPIYQESDMIIRTIRDIFTSEIDTIWIDEPSAFERAQDFLKVVMPRFVNRLKLYDEKVPLFHKYGIEEEISKIQRRHVPLPEGGSIVIDPTEALVAIDVNSGNFRVEDDAERTAYEMNLRAAREIARQLRLRDLGGVIVNDFIDMREERHRRGVERALREAIKRDRARTKVLRMSAFGLIEMTRQRIRPSLKRSIYEDCTHCGGAGVAKTAESMAIDVMRLLALASHRDDIRKINISVCAAVATYLTNRKRREIATLEHDGNLHIHIGFKEGAPAEHLQIDGADSAGAETRLYPLPIPGGHRRGH